MIRIFYFVLLLVIVWPGAACASLINCEDPQIDITRKNSAKGIEVTLHGIGNKICIQKVTAKVNGEFIGNLRPQCINRVVKRYYDYLEVSHISQFNMNFILTPEQSHNLKIITYTKDCEPVKKEIFIPGGYRFDYAWAMQTSDTGVTVKIYVTALDGSPLDTGDCPVCLETPIAMRVDQILVSAYVSTSDDPRPYILYDFPYYEYEKIMGRGLWATFYVYGDEYEQYIHFEPVYLD